MNKFISILIFLSLTFFINSQDKKQNSESIAIFAAGCFWCIESDLEKVEGVISVVSGYTGGNKKNPTYEEVSSGGTGHTEAVKVTFDNKKISYAKLLEVFWKNVDPTVKDRQFCDIGSQYRSGIFYLDDSQKKDADKSKVEIEKKLSKVYTEITKATEFYIAEEYHQDYYKKNPLRYKYYRNGCGRDKRLEEIWKNK